MQNTSMATAHNQDITERDDLFMDADWNLTTAHVRGARQAGYMPEPVSLTEDGVIVFVNITNASIAPDTPCVPGARKVSKQYLQKTLVAEAGRIWKWSHQSREFRKAPANTSESPRHSKNITKIINQRDHVHGNHWEPQNGDLLSHVQSGG